MANELRVRSPALFPELISSFGRLVHRNPLKSDTQHLIASTPESEEPMPPDYELQTYWNKRFEDEKHFEWLGDGKDTILPHVRAHILGLRPSASPARLLHLGAGTSSLSERLRELYLSVYGENMREGDIVNTDFARNLVERKREAEARRIAEKAGKGMQWVCADALNWSDLEVLARPNDDLFDLVVEKSTSDAISCGEDVSYEDANAGLHPDINQYLKTHQGHKITLSPVEILAIHLSSLVRPGGLWVALTFSSDRFPFLSFPGSMGPSSPRAASYWHLENVIAVDAPTGMQSNAHAPVVQHYVCLIRRKNTAN
ncbi:hypothetical protein C8Q78DRAFT_1079683 [Trametes maxima]|nr:hypothetical protein C8Q78DRAFT_1079683 [Trametes maxima]